MSKYISVNEVLVLASKSLGGAFKKVPRKKIMFQGRNANGEMITLCSPQSKMHTQGFYWVDITQEQAHVLDEADKGLIFFRLEGNNLLIVQWKELREYLTIDCMKYNVNEKNHWKLNIYKEYIRVNGNDKKMPIEILHYEGSK